MSTEPKVGELVPEWCMKCGSSIFMLPRAMRTEWRIAGIIASHYAPVAEAHAAEVERLKAACRMAVNQWDCVTVPRAACEGCPDPDYVAACRAALEDK